ncbi:hypothetical protein DFH29DRAFT_882698 [Suillus ampliporus]|nr:hypothetical protein DFH29DRAFT_882698 [Suillus ampliporus]
METGEAYVNVNKSLIVGRVETGTPGLLLNQKTRFNPYGRPSPHSLRGTISAYETQELKWGIKASIKSYERELQQREDDKDVWMGSTMDFDLPISTGSGTYGCVEPSYDEIGPLAIDSRTNNCYEARSYQYQSPKKRKLVRGLHTCINKYINHHCEIKHASTDQLRKRMHIALQAALLDVDVDEIMLPEASSDQVQVGKHDGLQQECLTPLMVARQFFNGVSYLLSLGTAVTTKPSVSDIVYKTDKGYPATMPGTVSRLTSRTSKSRGSNVQ